MTSKAIRNPLILVVALLLLDNARAKAQSLLDFYPLHIGDFWEYERLVSYNNDTWETELWKIRKVISLDTSANGKAYYKVVEIQSWGDRIDTTFTYERVNEDFEVRIYDTASDSEQLYFILSDDVGLYWRPLGEPYRYRIDAYSDSLMEIGEWWSGPPFDIGPMFTISLRRGIGRMEYQGENFLARLVRAEIDGVLYHFGNVSVEDERIERSPASANLGLEQNYPNPFNSSTTIRFDVPVQGTVRITIYNVSGETVRTLLHMHLGPGEHQVYWNASGFPSGLYFCEMQMQEITQIRKMILVR